MSRHMAVNFEITKRETVWVILGVPDPVRGAYKRRVQTDLAWKFPDCCVANCLRGLAGRRAASSNTQVAS